MCSERWSSEDEKELSMLIARKQEVMGKRRTVLHAVVYKLEVLDRDTCYDIDMMVDELIAHADEITTALKPFTRKETGVHRVEFPELKADVKEEAQ